MGNRGASGTGGSGSIWHGLLRLTEGQYIIQVGSGGYGYRGGVNDTPPESQNGGQSGFWKPSTYNITCNGGGAASSWQYGATAGTGGTVSVNGADVVQTFTSTNGIDGNTAGYNATSQGVFPVSGHTWGGTGNASGYAGGGGCSPSYHGYAMLRYKYTENKPELYAGTDHIKNIYQGSNQIKYVYKGPTLIWQRQEYTSDQILYENNTPGRTTININMPGVYELYIIGGGGGSSGSGGGGGGGLQTTRVDAIAGS